MQVSALKLGTRAHLGMLFIAQRMHVCIAALRRNGNKFAPVFVCMYLVTLMILQPVCRPGYTQIHRFNPAGCNDVEQNLRAHIFVLNQRGNGDM